MKTNIKYLKFGLGLTIIIILIGLVFNSSYLLISNSIVEKLHFDEKTSKYISFNYSVNDNQIIKLDKPKILNDFFGKRMSSDNYFDFEVAFPRNYELDRELYYSIILVTMCEEVDNSFIKVYLTDQNNKAISGYKDVVPVLSALTDTNNGKVIYTGSFSKNNVKDRYRLRIWVSNEYDKKINNILAYQLQIKIK